jgi:hypothetical protein
MSRLSTLGTRWFRHRSICPQEIQPLGSKGSADLRSHPFNSHEFSNPPRLTKTRFSGMLSAGRGVVQQLVWQRFPAVNYNSSAEWSRLERGPRFIIGYQASWSLASHPVRGVCDELCPNAARYDWPNGLGMPRGTHPAPRAGLQPAQPLGGTELSRRSCGVGSGSLPIDCTTFARFSAITPRGSPRDNG